MYRANEICKRCCNISAPVNGFRFFKYNIKMIQTHRVITVYMNLKNK